MGECSGVMGGALRSGLEAYPGGTLGPVPGLGRLGVVTLTGWPLPPLSSECPGRAQGGGGGWSGCHSLGPGCGVLGKQIDTLRSGAPVSTSVEPWPGEGSPMAAPRVLTSLGHVAARSYCRRV